MFFNLNKTIKAGVAAFVSSIFLITVASAIDFTDVRMSSLSAKQFQLIVGKSTIINSPAPVKRVSVGNPEIADVVLVSPHDIYITGKNAGVTSLTLWSDGNVSAIYDIAITYDVSLLKQELHNVMPEEKDIRVISNNTYITLTGRVSSSQNLSKAMTLAMSFASEGKVNNLLEVGGVQQVMLEVRIAEIARSTTKRLGINFNYIKDNEFGISMLGGLSELTTDDNGSKFLFSPTVDALFSFNSGKTTWTGLVDALKSDGLAKVLAEPTLIALSGQSASFLAGGEFPIPVPQDIGTHTIEFKAFGVGLEFTPTVLGDRINIQVTPEVSELDFSAAVKFSGFVIPGLTTRKATTTIELKDGQSFAIAGLLRENVMENIQKFPLLGDIPVLGALFRSERFLKNETELVIVVTPKLVKPLDMNKQPLPTDFYIEPTDTEFFLEGRLEGQATRNAIGLKGQLDGDFGHVLPDLDLKDKKQK